MRNAKSVKDDSSSLGQNGVLKKIEVGGHRRYRRSDVEAVTLNRKNA